MASQQARKPAHAEAALPVSRGVSSLPEQAAAPAIAITVNRHRRRDGALTGSLPSGGSRVPEPRSSFRTKGDHVEFWRDRCALTRARRVAQDPPGERCMSSRTHIASLAVHVSQGFDVSRILIRSLGESGRAVPGDDGCVLPGSSPVLDDCGLARGTEVAGWWARPVRSSWRCRLSWSPETNSTSLVWNPAASPRTRWSDPCSKRRLAGPAWHVSKTIR